jgi:hypothetical protein
VKKLFLTAFLTFGLSGAALAEIVPIQNHSDSYSMSDVVKAWKGKMKSVQLVDNDAGMEEFCQKIIGKSVNAVENGIKRKVFSGRISAPKSFAMDSAVIAYVAKNPGSIGYVDSASVKGNVKRIK